MPVLAVEGTMYCEGDLVKTETKLRLCPRRWKAILPAVFALFLLLSAFGIRGKAASTQDYDMRITAIDIGGSSNYGDSVVLTTGGRTLLMDAGWEEKTNYVISWLKNNNRRKVDLYISHYHDDHMDSMLEILQDSYFTVGTIYLPEPAYLANGMKKNPSYVGKFYNMYADILSEARSQNISLVYLDKGDSFYYGNAKLEVLWGAQYQLSSDNTDIHYINNNSLVTRVSSGGVRYLTCGDCEASPQNVESQIVSSGIDLRADIYKASHHGSNGSNSEAFLKQVQPLWSFWNCNDEIASMGQGNVDWITNTAERLKRYGNCVSVGYNGTIDFYVKDGKIDFYGTRNTASSKKTLGNTTVSITHSDATRFPAKWTDRHLEMYFGRGSWKKDGNGYWFYKRSGGYAQNEVIYSGGEAYYFDSNGYMIIGWHTANSGAIYHAKGSGALSCGWDKIEGSWYYFDSETYTMCTGWALINNKWYYFGTDGIMKTGWQKIGDHWYRFGTDGIMKTGWQKVGNQWYYMDADGVMKTGWMYYNKNWYYMDENSGAMTVSWRKIDGKWYYMNSGGVMQTGRKVLGGLPYNLGSDGALRTGWDKYNSKWYYIGSDGYHSSGVRTINGKLYLFNTSTHIMAESGWALADDKWYYASSSGELKKGWILSGKKWYYLGADAAAVTGVNKIGGKYYYFDSSAAMVTSKWIAAEGDRYHVGADGALQIGWMTESGEQYYFDKEAREVFGKVRISEDGSDVVVKLPADEWSEIVTEEMEEENQYSYYFFDRETGALLHEGWIEDRYDVQSEDGKLIETKEETLYADETTGVLAVGKIVIDEKTYYFDEEGVLLRNAQVDGGFTDENGVWSEEKRETDTAEADQDSENPEDMKSDTELPSDNAQDNATAADSSGEVDDISVPSGRSGEADNAAAEDEAENVSNAPKDNPFEDPAKSEETEQAGEEDSSDHVESDKST